jgi:hypothetical protein
MSQLRSSSNLIYFFSFKSRPQINIKALENKAQINPQQEKNDKQLLIIFRMKIEI